MKSPAPPIFRRPLFWIAFVILALLAGAAFFYFNQPASHTQTTATVTRGELKATVNANGRVRAQKSVRLAFPLSGLVKTVNVQEGDAVQADQVLVELEATEITRRLNQARMNLQAREQDLAEAQQPPSAEDLEIAQQSLKKAALALAAAENRYEEEASDQNRITQELAQSDYDIARANFERQTRGLTQGQLDDLNLAVEHAKLDVQAAQETLAQAQLKAPFAGIVTEVNTKPGELLGGYNAVIALSDLTRLELVAEIDEIDVAEVNTGQTVELRFDAFPGESATGTLSRLFPAASNDRGATVYQAIIALDPTELKLRPGMGATVNIATIEKKDVLRVPSRAIKAAGSQKIVVLQDGNETRNVIVETGLSDGNNTEIISGVSEGAVVVLE
jgi:HlyD family secretion protein